MALTAATDAVTPFGIETRNQRVGQSTISKSYATCSAFVLGMMVATTGLLAVQHYGLADASLTKFFLASTKKGHHLGKALPASIPQSIAPSRFQQRSMSLQDVEDTNPPTMSIDEKDTMKQTFGSPLLSVSQIPPIHSIKAAADMEEPVRTHGYGTGDNAVVPAAKLQSSPLSLFTFSLLASSLLMIIIGGFLFLQRRRQTSDMGSMGGGPVDMFTPRPYTFHRFCPSSSTTRTDADEDEEFTFSGAVFDHETMDANLPGARLAFNSLGIHRDGPGGICAATPDHAGHYPGLQKLAGVEVLEISPQTLAPPLHVEPPRTGKFFRATAVFMTADEERLTRDHQWIKKGMMEGVYPKMPSDKQIKYATRLSAKLGETLPEAALIDGRECSRLIGEMLNRIPPSQKQVAFANTLAERAGVRLTREDMMSTAAISTFIEQHRQQAQGRGSPSGGLVTTQIVGGPSDKQLAFAVNLARELKRGLSHGVISDKSECSAFIEDLLAQKKAGSVPPPGTNDLLAQKKAGSVPPPGTNDGGAITTMLDADSIAGLRNDDLFADLFAELRSYKFAWPTAVIAGGFDSFVERI